MPVKTIKIKCGYRYKFKGESIKQMNRFYGDRFDASISAAVEYASQESGRKSPEVFEVYQVLVPVHPKKKKGTK